MMCWEDGDMWRMGKSEWIVKRRKWKSRRIRKSGGIWSIGKSGRIEMNRGKVEDWENW